MTHDTNATSDAMPRDGLETRKSQLAVLNGLYVNNVRADHPMSSKCVKHLMDLIREVTVDIGRLERGATKVRVEKGRK